MQKGLECGQSQLYVDAVVGWCPQKDAHRGQPVGMTNPDPNTAMHTLSQNLAP